MEVLAEHSTEEGNPLAGVCGGLELVCGEGTSSFLPGGKDVRDHL